jgi:hypothetical protein
MRNYAGEAKREGSRASRSSRVDAGGARSASRPEQRNRESVRAWRREPHIHDQEAGGRARVERLQPFVRFGHDGRSRRHHTDSGRTRTNRALAQPARARGVSHEHDRDIARLRGACQATTAHGVAARWGRAYGAAACLDSEVRGVRSVSSGAVRRAGTPPARLAPRGSHQGDGNDREYAGAGAGVEGRAWRDPGGDACARPSRVRGDDRELLRRRGAR